MFGKLFGRGKGKTSGVESKAGGSDAGPKSSGGAGDAGNSGGTPNLYGPYATGPNTRDTAYDIADREYGYTAEDYRRDSERNAGNK